MDFDRFKQIIITNKEYEESVNESVIRFADIMPIQRNFTKVMKEIGEFLDIIVLQIPMRSEEIGAVSYKTKHSKYIILNSNQPSCKMYFSFYHDIYHVLNGSTKFINELKEVHLNKDYLYDENEIKANLFSAKILMPDLEFKKMYDTYSSKDNAFNIVILKLMNYFNSPYVAVLLRLFELNLLKSTENVETYLKLNEADLIQIFCENGISSDILKPTFEDDSTYLTTKIEKEAQSLISQNLLDEAKYDKLITRINIFIEAIKK